MNAITLVNIIIVLINILITLINVLFRASLHFAGQAKRPNPKLLSRGEDRSPLKYIISVILSDSKYFIEKRFCLLTRVWVSILGRPKFLSRG